MNTLLRWLRYCNLYHCEFLILRISLETRIHIHNPEPSCSLKVLDIQHFNDVNAGSSMVDDRSMIDAWTFRWPYNSSVVGWFSLLTGFLINAERNLNKNLFPIIYNSNLVKCRERLLPLITKSSRCSNFLYAYKPEKWYIYTSTKFLYELCM